MPTRIIEVERERYDGTMRARRGGLTAEEIGGFSSRSLEANEHG
jgi:hypothetical protein